MITPEDGKICAICGEYFNPWAIRSIIAKGGSHVTCRCCGREYDIDDLEDLK